MQEPEALLRLQEIDLALMRHKHTLENLPQRTKVEQIRAAAKKLSSDLTSIVGARKDIEMDIADHDTEHHEVEELVSAAQDKASADSQDYRSVRDLEGQLSMYAKRLEKIEFESAALYERLARAESAEKNARARAAQLERERTAQVASYQAQIGDIRSQVNELLAERGRVLEDITPEVVSRYDAARRRFKGIAVETLAGNCPSHCRVTLQAGQYADLRHAGPIAECPYCHRMLVMDEGVAS